jgi:DNA-binding CsgD family transcriptional regulator
MLARALVELGFAAPLRGDPQAAIALFTEAEALFRELGRKADAAHSLIGLAATTRLLGNYTLAEDYCTRALELARDVGRPTTIAQSLDYLAFLALLRGDLTRAEESLHAAVPLCLEVAHGELLAYCALHLAGVALRRGNGLRSAKLLGAADGFWDMCGSGIFPTYHAGWDHSYRDTRRRLGRRAFAAAFAEGQPMNMTDLAVYATMPGQESSAEDPLGALTPREREVARLVARGMSNSEIANTLVLTPGTARVHVEHFLGKLGLHSRAQLAAWAADRGVLRDQAQ